MYRNINTNTIYSGASVPKFKSSKLVDNVIDQLVFASEDNQEVLTTSLIVAKVFGKEHSRVLRDIRELQCSAEFAQGNFALGSYLDENQQERPMNIITKDGFTLLAMGYRGKKAMQFKEAYIKAFNHMEAMLKEKAKPLTGAEYLLQQAQLMVEQERRLANVENRLDKIEQDKKENTEILLRLELSANPVPEQSIRSKVNQVVRSYAESKGVDFQSVWRRVYSDLYSIYHISLKQRKHNKGESNLDVAERIGCMDKIYDIVSNIAKG